MNGIFVDFDIPREKWNVLIKEIQENTRYHIYATRHGSDGDCFTPVSVKSSSVIVNRCGWFITDKPVDFTKSYDIGSNEIAIEFVLEQLDENIGNDDDLDDIVNVDISCVDDIDKLFKGGTDRDDFLSR